MPGNVFEVARPETLNSTISNQSAFPARGCRHWRKPRTSGHQIIEKFGWRLDAGHQEMVAGAGARHIEQVPFALVDFFEVGIIGDILDALLRRNYLIVARHDRDDTKQSKSAAASAMHLPGPLRRSSAARALAGFVGPR